MSVRNRKDPDFQSEKEEDEKEVSPPIKEVIENICLKDLEEPWLYFNEGVLK